MSQSLLSPETEPATRRNELRSAALQAAIALLTEEGWDAVTQPKVAERSGLGRATIYRYWPDRTTLVHDAVLTHMQVTEHSPPTGDLRQDLLTEMHHLQFELTDHDLGPVLAALIDRAEWQPAMRRLKHRIAQEGTREIRILLQNAIEQGDLAADTDVEASISILVGPLIYRRLISAEENNPEFVEWLVESFLTAHPIRKRRRSSTTPPPPPPPSSRRRRAGG